MSPRVVRYRGELLPLGAALVAAGIKRRTFEWRTGHGWSVEEALELPPGAIRAARMPDFLGGRRGKAPGAPLALGELLRAVNALSYTVAELRRELGAAHREIGALWRAMDLPTNRGEPADEPRSIQAATSAATSPVTSFGTRDRGREGAPAAGRSRSCRGIRVAGDVAGDASSSGRSPPAESFGTRDRGREGAPAAGSGRRLGGAARSAP